MQRRDKDYVGKRTMRNGAARKEQEDQREGTWIW